MKRLKHKSRRRGFNSDPGIILVGQSKYQIDENGEVIVSDDDASLMLQGTAWSEISQKNKKAEPDHAKNQQKTEQEHEKTKPEHVKTPHETQDDEKKRNDLVKRAEKLGLKIDKRQSTAKISTAIEMAEKEKDK